MRESTPFRLICSFLNLKIERLIYRLTLIRIVLQALPSNILLFPGPSILLKLQYSYWRVIGGGYFFDWKLTLNQGVIFPTIPHFARTLLGKRLPDSSQSLGRRRTAHRPRGRAPGLYGFLIESRIIGMWRLTVLLSSIILLVWLREQSTILCWTKKRDIYYIIIKGNGSNPVCEASRYSLKLAWQGKGNPSKNSHTQHFERDRHATFLFYLFFYFLGFISFTGNGSILHSLNQRKGMPPWSKEASMA